MKADDFVRTVRGGNDKLRVDDLVLDTGESKLTGKGWLRIEPEQISVEFFLDPGLAAPPRLGTGVGTKKDFWQLSGCIEGELHFRCPEFSRGFTETNSNGLVRLSESLRRLELEVPGWDPHREEKIQQSLAAFERVAAKFRSPSPPEPNESSADEGKPEHVEVAADTSYEFQALFSDYKLRDANAGSTGEVTNAFLGQAEWWSRADTLMGETSTYRFAFIQEKGSHDLRLYLRPKKDAPPTDEAAHWRKFHALLAALAFTHGINPWPYRIEYWRGDEKRLDQVMAPARLPRTPHSPFSGLNHEAGVISAMCLAAERLEAEPELGAKLTQLLFLFRQAGDDGVYFEPKLLTICSLFESLVKTLFVALRLEESPTFSGQKEKFDAAKLKLLESVKVLSAPEDADKANYERLAGSIRMADPWRLVEKLEALCQHLGLAWEGDMKLVFKAWKRVRNALAHQLGNNKDDSEATLKEDMLAESRIAGGFNAILLKFFGYSGVCNTSVFEPGFRRM